MKSTLIIDIMGKLPELVILAMVSDTDMSGGYQVSPKFLCIQTNEQQIPRLAYQPSFANRD
ncbi:MAG: hypothetical protein FD143_3373 [Ignavibacteria bacterium]|nr:MAG: hypothetical protein FD143_3373 [Ignavibacteria bacterium]